MNFYTVAVLIQSKNSIKRYLEWKTRLRSTWVEARNEIEAEAKVRKALEDQGYDRNKYIITIELDRLPREQMRHHLKTPE